jgi:hypothetical protein
MKLYLPKTKQPTTTMCSIHSQELNVCKNQLKHNLQGYPKHWGLHFTVPVVTTCKAPYGVATQKRIDKKEQMPLNVQKTKWHFVRMFIVRIQLSTVRMF